jgi:hypothetical protein
VVAGSVVVGYAGSFLAFWLLFRLLSLYPDKELLRIFATFMLVGAVSGMHYTGLNAAHFVPEDGQVTLLETPFHTPGKTMYYFTIIISIIISVCVTMLALADLRTWLINLSIRLGKADKIINDMKPTQGGAMEKAIMKYKRTYYTSSGDMKFKTMYDAASDGTGSRGSRSSNNVSVGKSSVVPMSKYLSDAEEGGGRGRLVIDEEGLDSGYFHDREKTLPTIRLKPELEKQNSVTLTRQFSDPNKQIN